MSKHMPTGATFADWLLIKPKVTGETVTFTLTAPTLDERIAAIIGDIAAALTESTSIEPMWVP